MNQQCSHTWRLVLGATRILLSESELGELAEWRVTIAAPRLDLGGVKFMIIVTRCRLDAKMLGVEGLDNHLSSLDTTPGAACYLGKQCKGSFRGRKIGEHEGD